MCKTFHIFDAGIWRWVNPLKAPLSHLRNVIRFKVRQTKIDRYRVHLACDAFTSLTFSSRNMGGESYLTDQHSIQPLLPRSLSSPISYVPSSSMTSTTSLPPESAHSLKEQLRKRKDAIVALATPIKRTLKKPKTLYPLKYGHGLRDL